MIRAESFLSPAREAGYDFFTGVPCPLLAPVVNRAAGDRRFTYVGATGEGEAVGVAAGAWLAGRRTVVLFQNSGLGNAISPLASLNVPFRIPTLLIVTWRAGPGGIDEPWHEPMGTAAPALLDIVRIPHRPFPSAEAAVRPALREADAVMAQSGLPFAFIMDRDDVAGEVAVRRRSRQRPMGWRRDFRVGHHQPTRFDVLERLLAVLPEEAAIIAATGTCGHELFALSDRRQHLYLIGSTGCAGPLGLGVAINARRPVVVLDGDGAAMMKMGAMATIGAEGPANLVHVILDNGIYESTDGQPTVSASVDFSEVALACGYAKAFACDSLPGLERSVAEARETPGPHLIHVGIRPGGTPGFRSGTNSPGPAVDPPEVARRFKEFLAAD